MNWEVEEPKESFMYCAVHVWRICRQEARATHRITQPFPLGSVYIDASNDQFHLSNPSLDRYPLENMFSRMTFGKPKTLEV